jgi:hypothetical protein
MFVLARRFASDESGTALEYGLTVAGISSQAAPPHGVVPGFRSRADARLPRLAGRLHVDRRRVVRMWMSPKWNGVPDAFRFFVTILMVLIYLVLPDRADDS